MSSLLHYYLAICYNESVTIIEYENETTIKTPETKQIEYDNSQITTKCVACSNYRMMPNICQLITFVKLMRKMDRDSIPDRNNENREKPKDNGGKRQGEVPPMHVALANREWDVPRDARIVDRSEYGICIYRSQIQSFG